MLNFPERYCEKKKRRACVVFDEFQELGAFDTDSLLEREMRSAFQHHQLCSCAFLGSKTHLMQELFKDKNRPFYNFGMHVELGTIAESEWISHIDEQFVRTEVPAYSPDYSRHVLRCSKGHPYYTQMLCSELWELLVHGPGHSREPVADALESILEKENHAFVELWDSLSSRERRLCAVLSRCDTAQVFSSDFISLHRLPSPSSMQGVVRRLLRRGVLQRDAPGYSLSDPLFRRWCLRREEDGAAGAQPEVEA
jgi:hypothetical protein